MRARLLWFCGKAAAVWLPYVAFGGLAGVTMVHRHLRWSWFASDEAHNYCFPQIGLFGLMSSACPVGGVDLGWFVLLGLPRLCLTVLVFAPAEIAETIGGGQAPDGALAAVAALLALGLVAVPCALSLRYWLARSATVASLMFLVLAAEVFVAIH